MNKMNKLNILELTTADITLSSNHNIDFSDHEQINYKNQVCVKPWGHEFLIYSSKKIAIWILKINQNEGTSLHTHFKKDTLLFVISGCIKLNLIDSYKFIKPSTYIYIPKRKFHSISSMTHESYIMEIEIFDPDVYFSNKNDLLRVKDYYVRSKTGYASSVTIIKENLEKYNYFYLNADLKKTIHNTTLYYNNLSNILYKSNEQKDTDIFILLDGTIVSNNKFYKEGSVFYRNELTDNIYNSNLDYKFIKLCYDNLVENKIIYSYEELSNLKENIKPQKIILTCGCFDILHVGHIKLLHEAKKLGDVLIVCLSSDEQIKYLKGNNRPINNLNDRLKLFINLVDVDYVFPYEENINNEEQLDKIMNLVEPEFWVKGNDYNEVDIRKIHPKLGKIKLIPLINNKSTTNIINKINNISKVNQYCIDYVDQSESILDIKKISYPLHYEYNP